MISPSKPQPGEPSSDHPTSEATTAGAVQSVARSLEILAPARHVALVGNPNTGKTTVFNKLTGFRHRVGNYPGVTVERRTGMMRAQGDVPPLEITDLPGTYSLAAGARDEAVVLEVLLGHQPDVHRPDIIVCVVDASNVARNLFLTTQVLELGRPVVIALNMMDVAERHGISIDVDAFSHDLGVRVVPIVANKGKGIRELKEAIGEALHRGVTNRCLDFPDCVCAELDGLCLSMSDNGGSPDRESARVEALQTLLGPGGYHETRMIARCGKAFADELVERRQRITEQGENVVEIEAKVRYAWIDRVLANVVATGDEHVSRSDRIDRVLTHPVSGLVVLVIIMGVCFQAIYSWAAPLMGAIDAFAGSAGEFVRHVMPAGALRSLVVDGMIGGAGAVLVFLPQILILFLFIAVLEDCGYMARVAFLLDRWMRRFGLGGKSFIPLLSSFACAVPGIMATRIIDDRRDRLTTILVAPLMSCSARLPVYVLLIAVFVPATPVLGGLLNMQAVTLLIMYALGAVVAIPIAWILKKTVFKGPPQSFLMELPGYKRPSVRTVLHRMFDQGRAFVVNAGTVIFAVSIIVWALAYYPRPAAVAKEFGAKRQAVEASFAPRLAATDLSEDAKQELETARHQQLVELDRQEEGAYMRASILARLGKWIEPAVRPLGWDWRIGTAVIASFPAREIIVATMGTIYNLGTGEDETSVSLRQKLHEATWPDGRKVFNVPVALSIMVFFALCCQCAATLAIIKRETNSWRWPIATFTYMTVLAYIGAGLTYHVATWLT